MASILEQVENELESLGTLVIWVGHAVVARRSAAEVYHPDYLLLVFRRRGEGSKAVVVGVVHGHYNVEDAEIGFAHLSRAVGKLISSSAAMHSHAVVREVSGVTAVCAGRIEFEAVGGAVLVYKSLHYTLCGRAATDVAQAYEQYFDRLLRRWVYSEGLHFQSFMGKSRPVSESIMNPETATSLAISG